MENKRQIKSKNFVFCLFIFYLFIYLFRFKQQERTIVGASRGFQSPDRNEIYFFGIIDILQVSENNKIKERKASINKQVNK
jgi:hypothetical protein